MRHYLSKETSYISVLVTAQIKETHYNSEYMNNLLGYYLRLQTIL